MASAFKDEFSKSCICEYCPPEQRFRILKFCDFQIMHSIDISLERRVKAIFNREKKRMKHTTLRTDAVRSHYFILHSDRNGFIII